jgi:hypothetical protein
MVGLQFRSDEYKAKPVMKKGGPMERAIAMISLIQDGVVPRSLFSFTSQTRNKVFRFERLNTTIFGGCDCSYKVPAFSYRRPNRISLRRQRFGS